MVKKLRKTEEHSIAHLLISSHILGQKNGMEEILLICYKLRSGEEICKQQKVRQLLFIILCKVFLTFRSAAENLKCDIQMKATGQYVPVVLYSVLYKVVLTLNPWIN